METADKKLIQQVIPHRGDMLLIDEVREYGNESAVGIHNVHDGEFWCAGHFPQNPIMPGVLQIEAMAQTACFMALTKMGVTDGSRLGYFTTIDKAKFFHMVKPGDILELHVELLLSKMRLYKFHGIAMVGGKKVSEATFTAIIEDEPKQ